LSLKQHLVQRLMDKEQIVSKPFSFLYCNLANITSILGVLPLLLLYFDNGFLYVIPLILFNNVMDDLDGILAAKLNIRSQFGANLDNVCDAVAHSALALAVGAHFGGLVLLASAIAAGSVILRATSRLNPAAVPGIGSPTNELMRHMLFALLLIQQFDLKPELILIILFLLHTITMVAPFRMPLMIRSLAKSATMVSVINGVLIFAWLVPVVTPFIAAAFILTYMYSFIFGGYLWLSNQRNKASHA
jgi:phosphatidylserine synthase